MILKIKILLSILFLYNNQNTNRKLARKNNLYYSGTTYLSIPNPDAKILKYNEFKYIFVHSSHFSGESREFVSRREVCTIPWKAVSTAGSRLLRQTDGRDSRTGSDSSTLSEKA